jgi:hypothetical protein
VSVKAALRLSRAALQATALTLGEATPDAETLIVSERVFEALLANFT